MYTFHNLYVVVSVGFCKFWIFVFYIYIYITRVGFLHASNTSANLFTNTSLQTPSVRGRLIPTCRHPRTEGVRKEEVVKVFVKVLVKVFVEEFVTS